MKKLFVKAKIFDCQDMPKEIREVFFKKSGSPSFRGGNDCYVNWWCHEERKPISEHKGGEIISKESVSGMTYIRELGIDLVSDWLLSSGAKIGEEVIVRHWW